MLKLRSKLIPSVCKLVGHRLENIAKEANKQIKALGHEDDF